MRRRLKNSLLIIRLLLGIITLFLWPRSYWAYQFISRERGYRKIAPAVVRQEVYAAAWTDGMIHIRRAWSDWALESSDDADRACRGKPSAAWSFAGRFQFEIEAAKLHGSRFILTRMGF